MTNNTTQSANNQNKHSAYTMYQVIHITYSNNTQTLNPASGILHIHNLKNQGR